MLPRIFSHMSQNKMMVSFLGLALIFAMAGCGGGGEREPPKPINNVTVIGKVDDGTPNSPISDAVCFYDDLTGEWLAQTTADENGNYRIEIPPGKEGFIRCHPLELPRLTLSTFISTDGRAAGDVINDEDVTPATTVVADIITSEDSTLAERKKAELLDSIDMRTDRYLGFVAAHSSYLYRSLLNRHINIIFGNYDGGGKNDGGGGEGGGGGGGAGGAAGDGGDRSPIANARCEFIVSNDLHKERFCIAQCLLIFWTMGY